MAEKERILSNAIFEELADWEEQLKHLDFDFDGEIGGPNYE